MKKITLKWITALCILTVVVIAVFVIFKGFLFQLESTYFWIVSSVVFYYIYELFTIITVDKKKRTLKSGQVVNLYMALKVLKIFLSLIISLSYIFLVKVEVKRFILLFVLVYFIFLLFDTIYLARGEKKLKK